jgi:hypothetical protein
MQDLERTDYADSFGIEIGAVTRRSVASWARSMFEEESPVIMAALLIVTWLLRLRLGPLASMGHVLGLEVLSRGQDRIVVGAGGPAVDLRLVGLSVSAPGGSQMLTLSTFLRIRDRRWRPLVALLLVGHRRVVPRLLERAVARTCAARGLHLPAWSYGSR